MTLKGSVGLWQTPFALGSLHWWHNADTWQLVGVITEAYSATDEVVDCGTTHDVRAILASWAYANQVHLKDVMSAAFWQSDGVFQHSYFRFMAVVRGAMRTLGPVVVAQQVVQPQQNWTAHICSPRYQLYYPTSHHTSPLGLQHLANRWWITVLGRCQCSGAGLHTSPVGVFIQNHDLLVTCK